MRGHTVVAEAIEYHERHTVGPDSVVPARFGKSLEIPEDLVPVPPDDRPTALHANHPLAKYVTVYEIVLDEDTNAPRERILHGHVEFVDVEAGVVVELFKSDEFPAFAVLAPKARSGLTLRIEYDEQAIKDENDRRLLKAMEIAAYYAGVIEEHKLRVEREKAEKERIAEQAEADRKVAELEEQIPE